MVGIQDHAVRFGQVDRLEIVHQLPQPFHLQQQRPHLFLFAREYPVDGPLDAPAQDGERCAQFMGDRSRAFRELPLRALQRLRHGVEVVDELRFLHRGPAHQRRPRRQVAIGQAPGAERDVVQGACQLGQEDAAEDEIAYRDEQQADQQRGIAALIDRVRQLVQLLDDLVDSVEIGHPAGLQRGEGALGGRRCVLLDQALFVAGP